MIKKILITAAVAASASFATWDFLPLLEAGKGTAEAGLYYDWDDEWSQAGINIAGRYTVIPNLEISIPGFGVQFWGETDCNGCANGGGGLRDLTIGGRYEVAPMAAVFLDLRLPIGTHDDDGVGTTQPGSDEFAMYFGGQFHMGVKEAPGLVFGAEAGLDWGFEHDNSERGLELHMGGEIDYTIPNVGLTPYLGLKFKLQITEDTWEGADGKEYGNDDDFDHDQFLFWLGASYALNQQFDVKAQLIFRNGDMDGDATGFYVACGFKF